MENEALVVMAWNPSPEIADARALAEKWDQDMLIVIGVKFDKDAGGRIKSVTFGRTKALCTRAKLLGDAAYDATVRAWKDL